MRNLFSNAVDLVPAQQLQSQPSKQVSKSINEILMSDDNAADVLQISDNGVWSRFNVVDFDNKVLYKLVIKTEGEFSADKQYLFSPSQESNEYVGYPQRIYAVKGTSVVTRKEKPAPKPVETPSPQGNMSPELMEQFMAFMQMQSQQQQSAPAPKESDMPF